MQCSHQCKLAEPFKEMSNIVSLSFRDKHCAWYSSAWKCFIRVTINCILKSVTVQKDEDIRSNLAVINSVPQMKQWGTMLLLPYGDSVSNQADVSDYWLSAFIRKTTVSKYCFFKISCVTIAVWKQYICMKSDSEQQGVLLLSKSNKLQSSSLSVSSVLVQLHRQLCNL